MTPIDEELFQVLTKLHSRYPQWRFGQLIANLAGWADVDIWDVEDEQLLAAARTHLDYVAKQELSNTVHATVP
jgi:hypothetical protein